jgi:hypothetical protein
MSNKYHAQPTTVKGIKFASKGEAQRYLDLLLLEQSGIILDLKLQVSFQLPANIKYIPDFTYLESGKLIAEDFKGRPTPVARLKAKLFRHTYPDIELRWTTREDLSRFHQRRKKK